MIGSAMIRLDGVTIQSGPFRLDNIDLSVDRGEYVTLMGPTGCGKTTVLECVCGLRPVIAGQVTVAGTVLGIVLALLTTPFVVAATVVLYFDQRVRVEAFDVDLLASQISGTPLPQASIPEEFGSLDGEEPPESPQAFPPTDQG